MTRLLQRMTASDLFPVAMSAVVALLSAADLITTRIGLAHGAIEGNAPVAALLADGFGAVTIAKIAAVCGVTLVLCISWYTFATQYAARLLLLLSALIAIALLAAVVASNLFILAHLG